MQITDETQLEAIINGYNLRSWTWFSEDALTKTIGELCLESAAVALRDVLPFQGLDADKLGIHIRCWAEGADDAHEQLIEWEVLFHNCFVDLSGEDPEWRKSEALAIADVLENAAKKFRSFAKAEEAAT